MNIQNIKFSHYCFSEDEVLYDAPSEDCRCEDAIQESAHFILKIDGVSADEAKNIIHRLRVFLDWIKRNPNYVYCLEYRLVYCNSVGTKDFNPMLIVSEETWDFLHGLFLGISVSDEFENF